MQCLLSIPELNHFFSEQVYKVESKNTKKTFIACNAIKDLIDNYSGESDKYLRPPGSLYKVCHSFLEANTQHDCQEFLRRLLGKIQEELNLNKKYTIPDKINYIDYWKLYRDNNPSFVDNMFAGLMRSSVICHKCKHQSGKLLRIILDTYDPFLDISLPIERRTRSLMQCFEIYFAKEDIDCEYKCESCKKKTSITKKLEIVISPSIMTLHIKRFEDFAHKFNGPIDFKYNLDITK
jgi:ubiquitin C-terminal hydrolase